MGVWHVTVRLDIELRSSLLLELLRRFAAMAN